ncbi:hypothetical protein SAMN03097699_0167 [Flavobacteriaceae bacterium MAR_2010_188]|nr:hypothetical protein SAMN03097699_0167 [Flavobacteriaceae bacterium MAR_2010_188]
MKRSRLFLLLVVILSIAHRFYFQFFLPVFNIDEISLGNNIKYSSFTELLYPLKDYQSAPPLYLLLQKLLINILPFKFWINIKILSFLASSISVILFYRLLNKFNFFLALFLLLIFCFNPYIVYNSLTLKQYGIDLVGILILLLSINKTYFDKWSWLFFVIWCLMSNVGLFGCAGYLIFIFFKEYLQNTTSNVWTFIKSKLLLFIAPLPYLIYFLWYINQPGANELKRFMLDYWKDSFIPLDQSIFSYIPRHLHEIWISFFSAYEIWGIVLMLISIGFLYGYYKKMDLKYRDEIILMFSIIGVHLVLNVLQMYPLSDRLFLYMTPPFLMMLGSSIDQILYKKKHQTKKLVLIPISCLTLFLYYTYSDYKNNDVRSLYNFFDSINTSKAILVTDRANDYISKTNEFTDNAFINNTKFNTDDFTAWGNYTYLVSKVHTKLKPRKTSRENMAVEKLLQQQKIKLIKRVAGYNIYITHH